MNKKISSTPYIIIIIVILVILWGQTRDETLLTEVTEQFSHTIPETTLAPEQNAFVAMAGFNVSNSDEMVTRGLQAILQTNQQAKQKPFSYNIKFDLPIDQKLDQTYQLPCNTNLNDINCLANISAQNGLIQQLVKEQQPFINNYLNLQQFSKFAHILPTNANSSVPYIYINSISQLLTAKAVLDIKAGNVQQGMQFLLANIKFYRHMLSSQQKSLEDTIIFTNMLSQQYLILNRLIHSGINLTPYLTELTPLLKPLSHQERNLLPALENERNGQLFTQTALAYTVFYTGNNAISNCHNDSCSLSRYPSRLTYKFNSTLNSVYLDWQPVIDFAKANYPYNDHFLNQLKPLQTIEHNHHTITTARLYERYGLFFLKNYSGEQQKNNNYYADGYTLWFIKLYELNNSIEQLNKAIHVIY